MNKLICVVSGKKQSGKDSLGKYIISEYLNAKVGNQRFYVQKDGKDVSIVDKFSNKILNIGSLNNEDKKLLDTYSVKVYSFADPLKRICIDLLGLDESQCYGSDDDKNSQTHILWENFPEQVCIKYSRKKRGSGGFKPASGFMTGREVMQVVGTEVFRNIDENCFARGTYSMIANEGYNLAIIVDGRFPNEITMGTEIGAKAIRLTRNTLKDDHASELALDEFPLGEFTLVIDNQDLEMADTHKKLKSHLLEWFSTYKVI